MLALEDLVDLGVALRGAGFKPSPQQTFAAQHLLLRLAADAALPDSRAALSTYFAPIFCTSALEQDGFAPLYLKWLQRRFPDDLSSAPVRPPTPVARRRPVWEKTLFALLGLSLVAAAWFGWQHWQPRSIQGTVFVDGQAAQGAEVQLGSRAVMTTGVDGGFRFDDLRAAELPLPLTAKSGERSAVADIGVELAQSRKRFYLGGALDAMPLRLELAAAPVKPPTTPEPIDPSAGMLRPAGQIDLSQLLPLPTWRERVAWPAVLLSSLPLLLFAIWQLIRQARRPVLQRLASRTPPQLREVFLPGGLGLLLPSLPLRRLAQEMRRRRHIDSSELQVEPTIAATLRAGGIFTPVRGSRVEPEYLALIDRAALSDHQALLSAELVAELARSDVLIERFDFDHDATVCRPREALVVVTARAVPAGGSTAALKKPGSGRSLHSVAHSVALSELFERHPEHRVLLFGDGAGCFDGFTGAPAPWLATLQHWQTVILLTPRPLEQWSRREWALQRLGVQVLPLSRTGLLAMGLMLSAQRGEAALPAAPAARALPSFERTPRRWLERDPPPPETVGRLCDDLRSELGPRGWAWVAACAAYPEIHWGITLRLGAGLVSDAAELERLLPQVARLVWFRDAYMPDWLRDALIERLGDAEETRARELLRAMLEALAARKVGEIPLHIALGEPVAELPWWRRAWNALLARSLHAQARDLLRTAPADSPLRDHVFLRFLSAQHSRRLDLSAPGALLRVLRAAPRAVPVLAGVAALLASALLAWQLRPLSLEDGVVATHELQFAGDGRTAGLVLRRDFEASLDLPFKNTPKAMPVLARIEQRGSAWALAPAVIREPWMAVSPATGRVLVARADGLSIERPGTRALPIRLPGQGGDGTFRFSDDGSRLAIRGADGIGVWDAANGGQIRNVQVEAGSTFDWTLSPAGNWLAARNRQGGVNAWNINDAAADKVLVDASGASNPSQLRFSPDGQGLALIHQVGIVVWDLATGQATTQQTGGQPGATGTLRVVAAAPDFSVQAQIGPDQVRLLKPGGEGPPQTLAVIDVPELQNIVFSPDARLLVTSSRRDGIRAWQVATGKPLGEPLLADAGGGGADNLTFSADGRMLAAASAGSVRLWSMPTSAEPATPVQSPPPNIAPSNSALQQLLAKNPALRGKTLALTGLRVRAGWIVDAVTPIFSEVLPGGELGAEHEGVRVGGAGGDESVARRPGYVISEIMVQRGIYETAQVVASFEVRWKRLQGGEVDQRAGGETRRFGLAKGARISEPPKRHAVAPGEFISDLVLATVLNNNRTVYLGEIGVLDRATLAGTGAGEIPRRSPAPAPAPAPAPVPVPAPSPSLPPEPFGIPPAAPSRSNASEIQNLLARMNSADRTVRRTATAQLMAQYKGSTEAIGLVISALDDRQRALRVEGRINVLTYLEASELGAWSDAHRSSAQAVLKRLRTTSAELGLGAQALALIQKLSEKLGP